MIDISVMFSLDYLQELVGEITFFERLPSIMQAWRRGEPSVGTVDGHDLSTYLSNPSVSSVTRSLPRCLNLLGTWTGSRYDTGTVYRVLPLPDFPGPLLVRKPTNRHEIEFISESLSARLLERICVTLNDAWGDDKSRRGDQVDDTDFDVARVRSMIQEIEALQAQLEATDDDDEQRALEEDLTGQILWLYWCGIRSEVDHILALFVNHIRDISKAFKKYSLREATDIIGGSRETADIIRGLHETEDVIRSLPVTADIIKRTLHVGPADDIAQLRRIMFDAGAGVSRHKLWLAARAAGRVGDVTRVYAGVSPAAGSTIGPPTTGSGDDATGVVEAGDFTDTTSFQVA